MEFVLGLMKARYKMVNLHKDTVEKLMVILEKELTALHLHRVAKATSVARESRPELTAEDLLNPDDYPEIIKDPRFTYEDGQAAGVLSAKIAVRSLLKGLI